MSLNKVTEISPNGKPNIPVRCQKRILILSNMFNMFNYQIPNSISIFLKFNKCRPFFAYTFRLLGVVKKNLKFSP